MPYSVGEEFIALIDPVRKPGPKWRSLGTISLEQWCQTGQFLSPKDI